MQTRLRLILILVPLVLSLIYAATRVAAFAHIFFEHAGIALTQDQIRDTYLQYTTTGGRDPRKEYIPKHIHQVWHDWSKPGLNTSVEDLPADWNEVRGTCKGLMPDWEYTLWTEQTSRDFIANEYPWFLSTYDGYAYPVQRVDTVRYFILRHFGGIYLDLDNGCLKDLTPLLYYPTWTTDGGRGALSNNILAAAPGHPFWVFLTDSLIPYNWNYFFPYVTISYASGQWFETAVWETYHARLQKPRFRGSKDQKEFQGHGQSESSSEANASNGEDQVVEEEEENRLYRIMMDDRPGTDPWIYFTQQRGGTWVNWDNKLFLWLGDHLLLIAVSVCGLLGTVIWSVRSCMRRGSIKKDGYRRVSHNV